VAFTFQSVATAEAATCSKPASTVSGDFLVAHVITADETVFTWPSGWEEHKVSTESLYSGTVAKFRIGSKVAGSSEPSSYAWTFTGVYINIAISGYSQPTSPQFDNSSNFVEQASGTTLGAGTVTTSVANALIVYAGMTGGSGTWSSPAGVSERADFASGTFFSDEVQAAAGTSTSRTFTGPSGFQCITSAAFIEVIPASLNQHSFRFVNDDGSESGSTFAANLNTDVNLSANDTKRLRYLIDATGDPTGKQFQLEFRRKPSGGSFGDWNKVT
jgi:hypothetical protein